MSTHKRVEILCVVCAAIACLICTAAYALRDTVGEEISTGHQMGYEQTLFDTSTVHSIDIVMDDWDSFIQTCENEEYASCTVLIDGEKYKNVAIRAKGNTSLQNVSKLGSERYSFKIEFDHYESSETYHGLDKLSLNNIIQDNTYMKDYLTYTMMNEFGVDSPLASYAYITVNGEEWGLYLAVESVEDSFLERIYGVNTGELYKPDSMSFGGGRGNGQGFDMDKFMEEQEAEQDAEDSEGSDDQASESDAGSAGAGSAASPSFDFGEQFSSGQLPDMSQLPDMGEMPNMGQAPDGSGGGAPGGGGPGGGMSASDVKLQYIDDDPDSYSNIFSNAKTDMTNADKNRLVESLRKLSACEDLDNVLDMDEVLRYFVVHDYVCNDDSYTGTMVHNYYLHESDGKLSMIPWDYNLAFGGFAGGDATSQVNSPIDDPTSSGFGFGFGGFGKKDSEASGEDSSASESEQMPEEGQTPEGEEMPENVQAPDGMQMPGNGGMPRMPGGGQGSSEGFSMPEGTDMPSDGNTSFQNFDSFTESDSRPMVDWIFSDEAYTQAYHELYQQFLDTIDIQSIIDETEELIAPYVERDPTKFCTYEEFEAGVDTLREFCKLRTQSVQGQLDGTIPSTEEGQQEDSSALVDASDLTLSQMGSMGNTMGNPMGNGSSGGGMPKQGESKRPDTDSGEGASTPVFEKVSA